MSQMFSRMAQWTSRHCGSPITFALAVLVILAWAITGPFFGYSDTWQLVINTGTTIVTFLMVFLIQNTQNRDAAAVHLKLDELIRVTENARNNLLDLEKLSDAELEKMKARFASLGAVGGIGVAEIEEVEASLEHAQEDISEAKARLEGAR
jgi:low affinity Fe/Cu permease